MRKFFISFDFEGIGGIAFWKETMGDSRYNKIATDQLLTFINKLNYYEPDCEIVVADSHAFGNNILWEEMPENVQLVRGYPREYYMIQELDDSFTDLILFGYHTAAGKGGMMDHTHSSSSIFKIKINGREVDEALINSALAGEYGVPLTFVYGDNLSVNFIHSLYPEVNYLSSKKAISRFSGVMKSRKELYTQLEESAEKVVKGQGGRVVNFDYPIKGEITLTDSTRSYMAAIIPNVYKDKNDDRIIYFSATSMSEFYRYLLTIINVASSAKNII